MVNLSANIGRAIFIGLSILDRSASDARDRPRSVIFSMANSPDDDIPMFVVNKTSNQSFTGSFTDSNIVHLGLD